MKSLIVAIATGTLVLPTFCQKNQEAAWAQEMKHLRLSAQGNGIELAALDMERNWATSVVHLKGNVEIRIWPLRNPALKEMVVRADEADYYEGTGKIDARGNVQLMPRRAQ